MLSYIASWFIMMVKKKLLTEKKIEKQQCRYEVFIGLNDNNKT